MFDLVFMGYPHLDTLRTGHSVVAPKPAFVERLSDAVPTTETAPAALLAAGLFGPASTQHKARLEALYPTAASASPFGQQAYASAHFTLGRTRPDSEAPAYLDVAGKPEDEARIEPMMLRVATERQYRPGDAADGGGAGKTASTLMIVTPAKTMPAEASAPGGRSLPDAAAAAATPVGEEKHGGGHGHGGPVERDPSVREVAFDASLFGPDPSYPDFVYDAAAQLDIYGGKKAVRTQRPLLELGNDFYSTGVLGEGLDFFGSKNRINPQLIAFGDIRTAVAYNDNRGADLGQIAGRINLDVSLLLSGTERFHAFFRPIDNNGRFTRYEISGGLAQDDKTFVFEDRLDPVTFFFEGDLGQMTAGFTDEYRSWDLPFAVGRVPLLMQNGIWIEDAFLGGAFAIPARNSRRFDITNFDVTFFAGFDEITSDAFITNAGKKDDHDAKMVGVAGFLEFGEGYMETGYAYLHDSDKANGDHSYHNFTVSFTKRYRGKISNSTRIIANVGQDPGPGFETTADGVLILFENSLVSKKPLTFVPYANFWAGFGKTQSVARAADGILRNTGILFESDALTGFPTLDDTGVDTAGVAIGVQNLFTLNQQLVAEVALVVPHGDKEGRAQDTQLGVGVRYQRPLNNHLIFRADAMYGDFGDDRPSTGMRAELRWKF